MFVDLEVMTEILYYDTPVGIHDAKEMYKAVKVSYGYWKDGMSCMLADGSAVTFAHNLILKVKKIEERNLVFCEYLNVGGSYIEELNPTYLINLKALYLAGSRI